MDEKTERVIIARVPGGVPFPCPVEMGCSEGGDDNIIQAHGFSRAMRLKSKREGEHLGKEINGLEHLLNGFDRIRGQVDGQGSCSALQPKTLDEHEKTADVIAVQMR